MKYGYLTVHFEHYWHCGSGQAGEGDVDLLPVTEACGLPYVPGRALRGRLKWTAREMGWEEDALDRLFGRRDARDLVSMGKLHVTNATMRDAFAARCRRKFSDAGNIVPEVSALYEDIASTSLHGGMARAKSLRRVRYAVPVTVIAEISLEGDGPLWDKLNELVNKLRFVGKGKHDGFGWCSADLAKTEAIVRQSNAANAEAYDLEIELLDDVAISETNATTGGHRTLDYIPGSTLMGAFARSYFRRLRKEHNDDANAADKEGGAALVAAKVAFGNGTHVSPSGVATIPMPLSWHHAKDDNPIQNDALSSNSVWNFAAVEHEESGLSTKQPVQMRGDWLSPETGDVLSVPRTQTLKTAISEKREQYETAAKSELFGYEAITKGSRFLSRIEVKDADPGICELVRETFDGQITRLGRSRRSEYGRARCRLKAVEPNAGNNSTGTVILLAESDLFLLDENGFPTLRPVAFHFGLSEEWTICPERSFMRFRRYSPWNGKRGGRDIERQVIAKGSVMVFIHPDPNAVAKPKLCVGAGQSEGLGRIRVSEKWLTSEQPSFGPARTPGIDTIDVLESPQDTNDLTPWIKERNKEKQFDVRVAAVARNWVRRWQQCQVKVSASQWGRLDALARDVDNIETLLRSLGTGSPDTPDGEKTVFGHGRVREKWIKGERRDGETNPNIRGSLAQEIRKALSTRPDNDNRFTLAVFRASCQRMVAQTRRNRS